MSPDKGPAVSGKKNIPAHSRLLLASPWLTTAAISLLTLIVVIFAANNLKREKQHLTESLLRKGRDTILFVGANIRAQAMTGLPDQKQLQHLLEQTAEDSGIAFIALTDKKGVILAHSDPARVGNPIERSGEGTAEGRIRWRILPGMNGGDDVFEIEAPFLPFEPGAGRGRHLRRLTMLQQGQDAGMDIPLEPECDGPPPPPPGSPPQFANPDSETMRSCYAMMSGLGITVGLSMKDLAGSIRQNYYQIIIMSAILLLVGLAGWLSLFIAQSYRLTRQTLSRMEAFTNLVMSRLPVGIIATDDSGTIQTINRAAAAMTGSDAETALQRPPNRVLPESLAALFAATGGPVNSELILETEEGGKRELAASSAPVIDAEGLTRGRVLLLHDLTDLKNLERQIRRHDRLVALGKMAAGVAHEVRNPLSSIKGFATLIASRFPAESEEGKNAGLLVKEVERLNRAITELLDYARPLPLKKELTDLVELAGNALRLMAPEAAALGVEFRMTSAAGTWRAKVDQDRMRQVLLNLYLNALQAMETTKGQLTVAVGPGNSPGSTAISVSDTGCGIALENLDRILDPYFTTKADGTGLGLAIVAKIIDEHGGGVRVTSKIGEGTTMTIELPEGLNG